MSFVDHEQKRSYVVTYKELAFAIVIFVIILIALYPKDMLKEQILSENSNYDLSMLYLKSLLAHSPEDESLMLILAEQSLRSGKKDLSLRLLDLLLDSKEKENRIKATLLSYELQKEDYYYFKDKKRQRAQKELLRKLFLKIYKGKMYKEDNLDKWYLESIFLNEKKAMYYFVKQKLKKEPKNIDLLEKAYYLSITFSQKRDSYLYVKLLQKYDKKRENKWSLDEYYMLLRYRRYVRIKKLLERKSKDSKEWKIKLAEYYLMKGMYEESSDTYLSLSEESLEYKEKRNFLFKSIEALQAGNKLEMAAKKAHSYEQEYMNDIVARKFLLRLYISTGNLDYAATLSKKIIKRKIY